MIRFLYGHQLDAFPRLRDTMFRDRADQFKRRLKWDVHVSEEGFERDEYDDMDPLYVIAEADNGDHLGSMRLLPTVGSCMVNDHFAHLLSGPVQSPLIWESTRFCLARHAPRKTAALLMLAAGEVMVGFGVEQCVAVFDQRMVRIYRLNGSEPEILGSMGEGQDYIGVGLWSFNSHAREAVCQRIGVAPQESRTWFDLHFGEDNRLGQVG